MCGGLLDALGARSRQRRVGLVDGDRRPRQVGVVGMGRGGVVGLAALLPRRANAAGTTTSETNGAAAIPSATAVWPLVMPSATASAKQMRESDSISTRPPNSAKYSCPASQPRAK